MLEQHIQKDISSEPLRCQTSMIDGMCTKGKDLKDGPFILLSAVGLICLSHIFNT